VGVYQTNDFQVVQAIRFFVENSVGELREVLVGNSDSQWESKIDVSTGTKIVGISRASGWWIDCIRFHFNDGSASLAYGGSGGDTDFHLLLSHRDNKWKGEWLGVWGANTDYLESIGLIFWPI